MNANVIFERCSRYIWPLARLFIKRPKRCKRCIISELAEPLNQGFCEACFTSAPPELGADAILGSHVNLFDKLNAVLGQRAPDKPYDALLMLSGGKDSAYILHRLRQEQPDMRILCAVIDNGFMSSHALKNAASISRKLDVDMVTISSHQKKFACAFLDAFRSLKPGVGSYHAVDGVDGALLFEVGREVQRSLGIPLLIGGLSWVQAELHGTERLLDQGEVHPLAIWRTSEADIREHVRRLGLLAAGSESPVVSNNELILPMSVIDILNNGYSSFEAEFATLVRQGKADRKIWLYTFEQLRFAARLGLLTRAANKTLGRLGLSIKELT